MNEKIVENLYERYFNITNNNLEDESNIDEGAALRSIIFDAAEYLSDHFDSESYHLIGMCYYDIEEKIEN